MAETITLTDHEAIRDWAAARAGAPAVVDISPAGGTPEDEDKAREMISALDRAQTIANAVATVAFLKGREGGNGKVGVVGFCWGGGMVNQTAVNAGADLAAAVAYYGSQPDAADVSKIKAKESASLWICFLVSIVSSITILSRAGSVGCSIFSSWGLSGITLAGLAGRINFSVRSSRSLYWFPSASSRMDSPSCIDPSDSVLAWDEKISSLNDILSLFLFLCKVIGFNLLARPIK